ncbi:MAG TPA: sulfotransferase [Burkholderiales bacterium]|nr:sulfotransferase [Burkholderiales bacterium]
MNASTAQPYLGENLILILSPPRSGSTLLQRMIGSHTAVATHPEPHILTPLAFQGYFYRIEKAAFNHKVAANAMREFVEHLPRGEEDYLDACRAYCSVLYTRALRNGKQFFVDKTPNYADSILPWLPRLLPRAKYVVLTRHPLAILSSRARTFYQGDYDRAHYARDLLQGFIPPIAAFLRNPGVPLLHLKYEDLVSEPEAQMRRVLGFIGLAYEEQCVRFGEQSHVDKTYGDPNIRRHDRPVPDSINAWMQDFVGDAGRRRLCEKNLATLNAEDLRTFGYPLETIWSPLTSQASGPVRGSVRRSIMHRLKWGVLWPLKSLARKSPFSNALQRLAHFCEVLLR